MKMRVRAIPDSEEIGNRKPRTRERELPIFRNPRNRETDQENIGSEGYGGGLSVSFLPKRHTFLDAKVLHFTILGPQGPRFCVECFIFQFQK